MSRALGSDSSVLLSKLVWTRVAVVSIVGDSPTTVVTSSTLLTARVGLTVAVKPMPMRMSSRTTVRKPDISKVTLYVPAGRPGKRYRPWALLVTVCAPSSAGLVAVTATPGTTAPLSSTTCPWMLPVDPAAPCAKAGPAATERPRSRNQSVRVFTVWPPLD